MQSVQLVEIAAALASNAGPFIQSPTNLADAGLQHYWASARALLDRWSMELKQLSKRFQSASPDTRKTLWLEAEPLLQDILLSEILTRVWAGLLAVYDLQRGVEQASPIARSIFVGHLEARNRVLSLMVYGEGLPSGSAANLNRMRQKAEKWTDHLLSWLAPLGPIMDLAHQPERVLEFSEDASEQSPDLDFLSRQLAVAALRRSFTSSSERPPRHGDLHEATAMGIWESLPAEYFGNLELFSQGWLNRMEKMSDQMEEMIDGLITESGMLP
jgi:hypothetical protein